MATATNSDGNEIQLTLSVAISDAITSWTDVACSYETETEKTLEILGQYFLTRNQFIASDAEIKYYIEKGLSAKDRLTLEQSAEFLNERNKSPEKKQLMETRNNVKRKIVKIFNRLLLELFPSFLPPSTHQTPPKMKPLKTPAKDESDADTIPYPANEDNDDDEITTETEEEPFDEELLSNLNLTEIAPKFTRSRYGNATASVPQDLFETPLNALMLLEGALKTMKGKVIFEPCCGNGRIVKFLLERGFTVIGRDLYSTEVKHDYLIEDDPVYDVLLTNPPFALKHQFFEKAMNSGKPFIMLLPLQFLTPKCSFENIKRCKIDIMIMNPSPVFLNGDVERQVGDCGWMFVNMGNSTGGHFTVERLPDL
jgi:hypothetical protein